MRIIGHVNGEAKARTFSDYLFVQGIANQVEADKENAWAIWIHDEESLARAKGLLAQYEANPNDPVFRNVAAKASNLRDEKRKEQTAYEKRVKERQQLFRPLNAYSFGPVTFILILMCVIVFIVEHLPDSGIMDFLFISTRDITNAGQVGLWQGFLERLRLFDQILPEVRHGEIWRLFTPMFIHLSFLHIFFNMLWLRDLGSMMEDRQGSFLLLVFILAVAMVSNVAQYLVIGGGFGGMSGVVYGLVGYIWIRGKLDPGSGLYLHASTVTMMIVWFFVCLIGILGPIANTCHAAGLLMGMTWGYLSSLRHR